MTDHEPHSWYGPCDGMGPYGECSICSTRTREFACYFVFSGWWQWSLGIHVDLPHPHLDVHVPGGYLRIGWENFALSDRRIAEGAPVNPSRPRTFHLFGFDRRGINGW